jgi:small conductance mechanosensitive channel
MTTASDLVLASLGSEIEEWLDASGPDVLAIVATLTILYLIFRAVFPNVARAAIIRGAHPADEEIERRADTIIAVVQRTAIVVFIIIGAITILPEFGVNITAIVTGLGIAGLALALGTQTLVKDVIVGIFLLAEDQFRQGDVIKIADVTGTVEAITLRRTVIRDQDGVVHSVPNGSIGVVSNFTRDYALVNLPVRVSYGEDLKRVESIVASVGKELSEDRQFASIIVDMPRVTSVESVGEAGVSIVVTTRTRPSARFDVAGELRRRLAEAFLAQGVRVPYAKLETPPPVPDGKEPSGETVEPPVTDVR